MLICLILLFLSDFMGGFPTESHRALANNDFIGTTISGTILYAKPEMKKDAERQSGFRIGIVQEKGTYEGFFYKDVEIFIDNKKVWPDDKIDKYSEAENHIRFHEIANSVLEPGMPVELFAKSSIDRRSIANLISAETISSKNSLERFTVNPIDRGNNGVGNHALSFEAIHCGELIEVMMQYNKETHIDDGAYQYLSPSNIVFQPVLNVLGRWNEKNSIGVDVVSANKISLPHKVRTESDYFTWPVGPRTAQVGHYSKCEAIWPGVDAACYWLDQTSEDTDLVWRNVQPFQRSFYKTETTLFGFHLGADFNLKGGDDDNGEMVYPIAKGWISKVIEKASGFGKIIFVQHDTSFGPYTSMYAHVNWIGEKPHEGQLVDKDTAIATLGDGDGQYEGVSHLHFEIRRGTNVDPGKAYTMEKICEGPEGQIDPIQFILSHAKSL